MTALVDEDPANAVGYVYLYDYLLDLIRSGRIRLDKGAHAGKTFTFHDSCKHGRELAAHYGKKGSIPTEPREIIAACVDDYVELDAIAEKNFCCGAACGPCLSSRNPPGTHGINISRSRSPGPMSWSWAALTAGTRL